MSTVTVDQEFYVTKARYLYNVALRMLWHPQDAEDAVQDILLKVHVALPTFRGDSSLDTWVYRIAVNHLLNIKKKRFRDQGLTFERFTADINQDYPLTQSFNDPVQEQETVEELKTSCTLALLQCLDGPHRIAFILGTIFALESGQAAAILDISEAAFRKRLSRARGKVRSFMQSSCGLVNPQAKCHCRRRLPVAIAKGRVVPNHPLFVASDGCTSLEQYLDSMNQLDQIATVYRSSAYFDISPSMNDEIKKLLVHPTPLILELP